MKPKLSSMLLMMLARCVKIIYKEQLGMAAEILSECGLMRANDFLEGTRKVLRANAMEPLTTNTKWYSRNPSRDPLFYKSLRKVPIFLAQSYPQPPKLHQSGLVYP